MAHFFHVSTFGLPTSSSFVNSPSKSLAEVASKEHIMRCKPLLSPMWQKYFDDIVDAIMKHRHFKDNVVKHCPNGNGGVMASVFDPATSREYRNVEYNAKLSNNIIGYLLGRLGMMDESLNLTKCGKIVNGGKRNLNVECDFRDSIRSHEMSVEFMERINEVVSHYMSINN